MCRCKLQFRVELSARDQSICKSTLTIDHICGITAYCKRRTVNAIWKSLPIGQPEKRCNALTGTTQSEKILGSDRLKRSRLFFFFLLYRNISTITWNSFHKEYLWKAYCFLASFIDNANETSLKNFVYMYCLYFNFSI